MAFPHHNPLKKGKKKRIWQEFIIFVQVSVESRLHSICEMFVIDTVIIIAIVDIHLHIYLHLFGSFPIVLVLYCKP